MVAQSMFNFVGNETMLYLMDLLSLELILKR